MTNLYCVNKKSKKFNGVVREARLNPKYNEDTHDIADKYLYNRATSSLIEPPTCGDDKAAILEAGVWVKKIDKVGQAYYTQNGEKHFISEFDEDIPPGALQIDPPSIYHETHNGTVWIENTVAKDASALQAQITDLKAQVTSRDIWLFRMIVAIWEIGVDKELWSATDITDVELKAKYVEAKAKLDQLRTLEN